MDLAVGALIAGLSVGLLYGLLGFVITFLYKTTGVANFAAGSMGTFEVFLVYKLYRGGLGVWVSAGLGVILSLAFGFLVYWAVFRPGEGKGHANLMVRSLGLWLLIPSVIDLKWADGGPFPFPNLLPSGEFSAGGVTVPWSEVFTAIVAVGLALLAELLVRRTAIGVQFQAMAEDFHTARLVGIRVRWLSAVAWGLAGVLALMVGLVVAPTYLVSSTMLDNPLIYAFAAAVIGGGVTSLGGTFVGGVIVGVITSYTEVYWDPYLSTAVILVLVTLTLIMRPQGLMGTVRLERL